MQIEEYFNFLSENDIRIKGTRIGIESVLYEYIFKNKTPAEIDQRFHTVTLEQVYATILYFLQNQQEVSAYLADYLEYCRKAREEQSKNPSPAVVRLLQLKTEQERSVSEGKIDFTQVSSSGPTLSPTLIDHN